MQTHLRTIAQGFESNAQKVLASSENLANQLLKTNNAQLESHTKEVIASFNLLDKNVKNALESMAKNYLASLEILYKAKHRNPKKCECGVIKRV